MPELKCTVQSCTHNKDYYCDLSKIEVGGDTAKTAEETCCDSFQERKAGGDYSYSENTSGMNAICCEAQECKYNNNRECHAGKISVEGSDASRNDETECATFCC